MLHMMLHGKYTLQTPFDFLCMETAAEPSHEQVTEATAKPSSPKFWLPRNLNLTLWELIGWRMSKVFTNFGESRILLKRDEEATIREAYEISELARRLEALILAICKD